MTSPGDRPAMTRQQLDELFHRSRRPEHKPATRSGGHHPVTSDLSIDETLLLHSIGWEPVDLVCGAAVVAVPPQAFTVGFRDPDLAAASYTRAVFAAAERLSDDCSRAGGAGVIGVRVDFELHRHVVHAVMVGTAVKPPGPSRPGRPFVSDLSTRDFCLLSGAGWEPVGLAFGTAMVLVPYRSAGTVLKQMTANVELTNLTDALYEARERAMERMQSSALSMSAGGVVAVNVEEGPVEVASHVVQFTAWGTAVSLAGDSHRYIRPRVVVPVDDPVDLFDLGGAMGSGR